MDKVHVVVSEVTRKVSKVMNKVIYKVIHKINRLGQAATRGDEGPLYEGDPKQRDYTRIWIIQGGP